MKTLLKRISLLAVCTPLILAGCNCNTATAQQETNAIDKSIYENLPFDMPKVEQPTFPNYEVNILNYGAKSDGATLNTEAINKAIKDVNAKGGGKVIIPQGLWLTGPIVLLSNVNLHTEPNALILFTDDSSAYPIIETSFEGLNTRRCQSPISAVDAENIAITGHGVFDGSGDSWRPVKKEKLTDRQWKNLIKTGVVDAAGKIWYPDAGALKGAMATKEFNNPEGIQSDREWGEIKTWLRPVLLNFNKCKKVLLEDVTFKNSPSWCLHPLLCEHITLNRVKVFNPWYSQNGDALDLESCKNALIINSTFDAGDDAICIKSGKDKDGRERGAPCQNVIVKNNTVLHGHGGFVVGSEMSGGVKNIYVSDCTFLGTDVGLRFKSTRGRGGVVEGIYINNIYMIDIPNEALLFDLFYGGKSPTEANEDGDNNLSEPTVIPATEETPAFRNIHISNVYCKGSGRAIFFNGLPEMPIDNVTVKDVVITDAKEGVVISQARNVTLDNIHIKAKEGADLQMRNVNNVKVEGELRNIGNKAETFSFN
ncbi:glycoside hydrolase family 28 protein [Bacteroides sp. 224]|uniref:glycoside hydrolase family 28 protein n=1 Tax=Bacteroides sp. 224 TaxID=2302936 RepID=UPI0013D04F9C|nr:glycoside hydrolase family 28 protein [Bacteroides sp. 224]NDV66898.1 glycoside hydrolase family 28 protein [Bacteroides sp. 224]